MLEVDATSANTAPKYFALTLISNFSMKYSELNRCIEGCQIHGAHVRLYSYRNISTRFAFCRAVFKHQYGYPVLPFSSDTLIGTSLTE